MDAFITNEDGSMYVHQLHGVAFVSWVAACDRQKAQRFPQDTVGEWARLISKMTGITCVPGVSYFRLDS